MDRFEPLSLDRSTELSLVGFEFECNLATWVMMGTGWPEEEWEG